MWRIMGLVFYNDKEHFVADIDGKKIMKFDRDKCAGFAKEKGIAMYDTAYEVRRLKDNASDKFLEIVTPTDIRALLKKLLRMLTTQACLLPQQVMMGHVTILLVKRARLKGFPIRRLFLTLSV